MMPNMCVRFGSMRPYRQKKDLLGEKGEAGMELTVMRPHMYALPSNRHQPFALKSYGRGEEEGIKQQKHKKKPGMASRVSSNFSDLLHKVAGSCLVHTIVPTQDDPEVYPEEKSESYPEERESLYYDYEEEGEEEKQEEDDDETLNGERMMKIGKVADSKFQEMEVLMIEVFEAVSAMKRAYVSLQAAHSPWDPDKMRLADAAMVAEFRRLVRLRERFRRGSPTAAAAAERNTYDPEVEELKKEVKEKEAQVENLRERLRQASGRKGRTRRSSTRFREVVHAPTPELFELCMNQVKEASKAFTLQLLSMMRSANWDITAAVRSIEGGATAITASMATANPTKHPHPTHAKHAIESYVCRKIFNGFENEAFYLSGSLSSLIQPEKHRRECFTQYRDMQSMDPVELLGILPDCQFGKFCGKKFLAIVHPKMEESFFGNLEQRRLVVNGAHPRTPFYSEFLSLAKAVWLLHKLAFSLDPPPSHFQATKGADFHPTYMESVVKFPDGGVAPPGLVVGFPVSPGFKIGTFVIKTRVYLVTRT